MSWKNWFRRSSNLNKAREALAVNHVVISPGENYPKLQKALEDGTAVDFEKEDMVNNKQPTGVDKGLFSISTHQGTVRAMIDSLETKRACLVSEENVEREGFEARKQERALKIRDIDVLLAGYKKAADVIENPMQAEAEKPVRRRRTKKTVPVAQKEIES